MAQITAALLPNGRQTFYDADGVPLVGGQVAFFIPSTTMPKDTWQDPYQAALNTNPVILDSLGSAAIYGTGQYRQIVYDNLGNLIWDQLTDGYPVNPSNFGLQTSISSASTTDLGTVSSNNVLVTGTAGISSFGSSADINQPIYLIQFQSSLTVVNSGTLELPGGINITTAASDSMLAQYQGAGSWEVLSYLPAAGVPQLNQANTWTGGQVFSGTSDVRIVYTSSATLHTDTVGYLGVPFNTQDATYTLRLSDAGGTINHTSASAHTWTIPLNASVAFPIGTVINLRNSGAGAVTIAPTGGVTLSLVGGSSTGNRTLSQYGAGGIVKESADGWYITGVVT